MNVMARETIAYMNTPSSNCLYLQYWCSFSQVFSLCLSAWLPIGCQPFQDCVLIEQVVPVNTGELPSEVHLAEFIVSPWDKDRDIGLTRAGILFTPYFLAYLASLTLTMVISRASVSSSIFSRPSIASSHSTQLSSSTKEIL